MKPKKSYCLLIILCIIILIILGYIRRGQNTIISKPDKIVIYYDDTTKEIDSSNEGFDKIVSSINKRFHSNLSIVKDIVDNKVIEEMKEDGLGVELIYSKDESINFHFLSNKIYYRKLYFQLTSENYGDNQGSFIYTFQLGDEEGYRGFSIGGLRNPGKVIKSVKNIVE